MISKGIQMHIQNLFTQLSKCQYQPTYQVQHQVISVLKLSSDTKNHLEQTLNNLSILKNQISQQDLFRYHFLDQAINKNTAMIQITKNANEIIKQIEKLRQTEQQQQFYQSGQKKQKMLLQERFQLQIQKQSNNKQQEQSQNKLTQALIQEYDIFSVLLSKIKFFDDDLNKRSLLKKQSNENDDFSLQNVRTLKQIFYRQIWKRVITQTSQQQKNSIKLIHQLCSKYKLPIKRNDSPIKPSKLMQKQKQRQSQNYNKKQKQTMNSKQKQIQNQNQKQKKKKEQLQNSISSDIKFISKILHRESCEYILSIFINNLLQVQSFVTYNSLFFDTYFEKVNKSIQYLFISQGKQSHNIQQPQWMFQYLHQSFKNNYLYLRDEFLSNLNEQIKSNLLMFTLQYNIQHIVLQNIKARLQIDVKKIFEFQPTKNKNAKQKQFQAFLCFNFLDELFQLQQELNITFSQEFNFIQQILVIFVLQRKTQLLEFNFDYEHKWIQQKIFEDFYNINYSKIDLKNIQAYNIVVNYCVLFQRLYSKFKQFTNPDLLQKIQQFYQQSITNMIAHIKSSFQKIYQNSGLKKIDIILAFKRVQNQFRGGLSSFIGQSIKFQTKVKSQYYDFLQSYFNIYALEELSPLHRKLIRLINQYQKYFSSSFNQNQKDTLKSKNSSFFQEWQRKLSNLNKLYGYSDIKIKNMFFTFLESTQFTEQGVSIFLEAFQPYLKMIYSTQGYSIIKMIIVMDKQAFEQYRNTYGSRLTFLNQNELKSIKNIRIKFS